MRGTTAEYGICDTVINISTHVPHAGHDEKRKNI